MAKTKDEIMEKVTEKDVAHFEEWETTRRLYTQLCLLGTVQLLLLNKLLPRFAMHRLCMSQEQKQMMTRANKHLSDAAKLLELQDYMASGLGKDGVKDFFKTNTLLANEGYQVILLLLMWQNATRHKLNGVDDIEKYMNGLSTGHERYFTKKLIDTFRLEENKK